MLWFDLLLFLICVVLFIYTFKREMRERAREHRTFSLIVRGALVILVLAFGSASAITYGQTRLIMQQRTYLEAMLTSSAEVRQADLPSSPHPEPCNEAKAKTDAFFTTYVTDPTFRGEAVFDHSVGAVLAVGAYQVLEQRGCVTAQAANAIVARARAQRGIDVSFPPPMVRFLVRVPLGVFSNVSLARSASYAWDTISPQAIAVRECFARLARSGITTPTAAQEKTCSAATSGA